MPIIQIVLDSNLLRSADRAAKKLKTNRSVLLREALRAHLRRLDLQEKERLDREGYVRYPDSPDELAAWDRVADWPDARSDSRSGSNSPGRGARSLPK